MNKIQCLTDKSDYEIYPDFLNFRIDDYWLDEKLEELYPKSNYRGLVPTLDFYLQREKEKQVVWQRILPDEKQTTICPILMCPDDNPSLYIAFQKVDNSDDEITIGVGKKVVDILKKNDFEVEWDGTANSKILIPHFKWQLIYNENNRDLSDYKEVVKRMTK